MLPQILRDAYRSLLGRDKIGSAADQVAVGDHVHAPSVIWKHKPTTTLITNDSSMNDDPHLAGITIPVGTYHVRAVLFVKTTAAQRFKLMWLFSGSLVSPDEVLWRAYDNADVLIQNLWGGFFTTTRNILYGANLAAPKPLIMDGLVNVSGAGDLKLQWAQLTAGGTNTELYENSFVRLTALA